MKYTNGMTFKFYEGTELIHGIVRKAFADGYMAWVTDMNDSSREWLFDTVTDLDNVMFD